MWLRILILLMALLGCAPGPSSDGAEARPGLDQRKTSQATESTRPQSAGPSNFSAERAWINLESLLAAGPRPAASPAAGAARTYLKNRLAASGLVVEELELDVEFEQAGESAGKRRIVSLIARLEGPSEGLLLVAAPYTSPERDGAEIPGANEGGSGAAIALELARALAEGPRSYSYLFAFVAGDGVGDDPIAGSRVLSRALARRGLLERVRAGLFLDRVGDADLRIARDLHSSGPYRDIVWDRAHARGHAGAFPPEGFDAPEGGHRALGEAGLRQIVALIDSSHGGAEPPGEHARTGADDLAHCAPESLGIVGTVALDSLRAIEERLVRLDRYSSAPADATRASDRDREAASVTGTRSPSAPASDDRGDGR